VRPPCLVEVGGGRAWVAKAARAAGTVHVAWDPGRPSGFALSEERGARRLMGWITAGICWGILLRLPEEPSCPWAPTLGRLLAVARRQEVPAILIARAKAPVLRQPWVRRLTSCAGCVGKVTSGWAVFFYFVSLGGGSRHAVERSEVAAGITCQ